MARGDLLCPLDGLVLGLPRIGPFPGTDLVRGGEIGRHVHMQPTGTFVCANGHRWRAAGDFLLERIA